MNLQELIDFHIAGAESCEAYAITPGASEAKNKDIGKHYNKRAKWHRDAVELLSAKHYGEIDLTPKRLAHAENVIEQQNNLIVSLRAELVESYSIDRKTQPEPEAALFPDRKTAADYSGYVEPFQAEAAAIYSSALDDVELLNALSRSKEDLDAGRTVSSDQMKKNLEARFLGRKS